jgi:uncharacterized protein YdhG (YjbR/CyaY superfamily)
MKKTADREEIKNVDEYILAQPQHVKAVLEKLRATIKKAAPTAEELISYGMPAYKFHGMLVYFAAFKNHCSFFPGNASLIKEFKEELNAYKTAKGTIQFTAEKPLPAALVAKIVKTRIKENLAKSKK